jgi:hypothetical protein
MIVKRKLKLGTAYSGAIMPQRGRAKKSPLVETSGLRYLDLISVLFLIELRPIWVLFYRTPSDLGLIWSVKISIEINRPTKTLIFFC